MVSNGSRGWQLRINQRKLAFTLAHETPHSAASVETKDVTLYRGSLEPYRRELLRLQEKPTDSSFMWTDAMQDVKVVQNKLSGSVRTAVPMTFGRISPDVDPLRQAAYQRLSTLRPGTLAR